MRGESGLYRALRALAGASLLALPALGALKASEPDATDSASSRLAAEPSFEERFAPFIMPPVPIELVPGAVDLSTFDPPLEPAGPRVIRTLGSGVASYYGRRFHGRLTANGERFNMRAMTAAHKTLPFGSLVRVTNPRNGRSVVVRINDRGPFIRGRVIDLSRAAAEQIGMIRSGHARVQLELVAR